MINSRDLNDLHPKVKGLALAFIKKCKDENIDVLITSTYRDFESQQALYNTGRSVESKSKGQKIVTNAKPGQSFHNWRVAFDFVPLVNGKAIWNDTVLFTKCGKIAQSIGLEWAGNWVKFKELAHCQYTQGLSITDFQNGKTIGS